ncbi:MAG: hypothetical protein NTX22_16135 [Ignavibacteriales bacterium]|nr:hypothetical protein [Ignavibacteriales bacterium]
MVRKLNNRQNKTGQIKKRIPVPQKPPKIEPIKKKYKRAEKKKLIEKVAEE